MYMLEIALRAAATLGCTFVAATLLSLRRRDHTHYLGALFCAGIIAFVVTSTEGSSIALGPWLYPLTFLCVVKAAWFWLFAKGLFRESFRVRGRHLALVAVIGCYGLWQQLAASPSMSAGALADVARGAHLGFDFLALGLVLLALNEAWRGLAGDLVEQRRRLRVLFVASVGAYLAIAIGVQSYNFLLEIRTPAPLVLANLGLMFVGSAVAAISLLHPRPSNWLEAVRQPASVELSLADRRLMQALRQAMEQERVYREEGLTIGRLARKLSTREHVLRRVINQGLGFRNFSDFLHSWRIREATARLGKPDERDVPVFSIALDVGYASIGPFNRAFKSRTGMTPSAFRKRATTPAIRPSVVPDEARPH